MKNLHQLLDELKSQIQLHTISNRAISEGSVGWHIEHILLVLDAVTEALSRSNPAEYKKTGFGIRRNFVMITGKIPRGKVKAPEAVRPSENFDPLSLQGHLVRSEENIKSLSKLSSAHYFTHPFLGDFRLRPALRFLKIHTNHHIKIINEIFRKTD